MSILRWLGLAFDTDPTVLLLGGWLLTTVLGPHAEPLVRALLGHRSDTEQP
jgi:hypothetical protein